jgi:oxygen-independent coproporphyrinogen-3 oxidase
VPPKVPLPLARTPGDAGQVLCEIPQSPGVQSLYIHIPFCRHKCHYCDFYSIVDARDRQGSFADRLIRELRALSPWGGRPLSTIFVGGGTPSLLSLPLWEQLLAALHEVFDLSNMGTGRGEFTVECNPETVKPDLLKVLRSGGVNRLSMGAQSFNPAHLKTLERKHDPASVARAIDMARNVGFERLSVDLIFAIPGQTLEDWRTDLNTVLSLELEHVSAYALTYEPNTPLGVRLARGEVQRVDEELEADMFALTRSVLHDAGLPAYEVSNFAKPGSECRHNLAYWRQEWWLAAGPSASAHVGGHRYKNVVRLDDYLGESRDGFAPIRDYEAPDPRRALSEWIMTGLRLREGIDARLLGARAEALDPRAPARVGALTHRLREQGLLAGCERLALTESGILIADRIIVDFLRALDP